MIRTESSADTAPGAPHSRARRLAADALHAPTALLWMKRAQRIRDLNLTDLLAQWPSGPSRLEVEQASRVALGACRRGERWFGFANTCLVRSLVLIGLLGRRDGLQLHIGFRSAAGEPAIEGHAWVALDGRALLPATDGRPQQPYSKTLTLDLSPR
jgi:hypothetical protein